MHFSAIASLLLGASCALAVPVEERAAACPTGITAAEASRVQRSFREDGVVPTLIPSITPQVAVKITYPTVNMDLGTVTTTLQTVSPPTFFFSARRGARAGATYSLFLVDTDVPGPNGPPVLGSPRINFLHWYVSGIKPCASTGTTTTIYEPPTPASPQEQHRYTWLVYEEPVGYKPNLIQAQVRPAFDLGGYVRRGQLGEPIGGNFMNQSITNGVLPPA
ncbi:Putative phosphatidylethanolamine-binding protein [Septoria linicola]|uniref:Phosphatidylethanolamine-binding protein n=1 Tax=Septoria linicola TaxID=215465 RepID=A0A9Q9B4X1_9PEZI|nr:putative phosphatidylethanolamine-binding protein [Septoria linicola]USW59018.1 Putative phosphatidylethanolamine-binding protein [Septoria linicola]